MRRLVWLTSACVLVAVTSLAHAQQVDLAVGGSTLWMSKSISASQAFLPPALKGGLYPDVSAAVLLWDRFGISGEFAYRFHQAHYNGFQPYRPFLYDINGIFAPRVGRKTTAEMMAGIGGETLIFYNQFGSCAGNFAGCSSFVNSNHFLIHLGGGVRYYFWHDFFARPEAHYYFVHNNFQFHSDHLFRIGASIGYSFGGR